MTPAAGEVWLVNLDKTSAADTFQVRSISCRRFVRRLGRVTQVDRNRIRQGLQVVLDA